MDKKSSYAPFDSESDVTQFNACVKSLENYGDLAGSEAITRALVAERTGKRDLAVFWLKVYEATVNAESRQTL